MAVRTKGKAALERNGSAPEAAAEVHAEAQRVEIPAPKLRVVEVNVVGTAPYVQNQFGAKTRQMMHDTQAEGKTSKSRKKRDAKDFAAACEDAKHVSQDGWLGIPAAAFRNAMIDACRLAGVTMTAAKQAVFILADGIGAEGTPLVKIVGEPQYSELPVRNASGVADLRARPMWLQWSALVRIRYDADMLRPVDVANLLMRAGIQVGVGEGRPFSKRSNGCGWGTFAVEGYEEEAE